MLLLKKSDHNFIKLRMAIVFMVSLIFPTWVLSQQPIQQPIQKPMPMDMKHQHSPKNLPQGVLTPQLNIALSEDSMSGVNLHLDTQNFQLESPTAAGNNPKNIVEGHAHLYVNGKKIQRVYASDIHIPGKYINKGVNQISVTLNGHDHSQWQVAGKGIISTLFINTEKDELITLRFSSFPVLTKK